jgi:hypothetical protein
LELWDTRIVAERLAKEKMFTVSILSRSIKFFTSFEGYGRMDKRELIDYICKINKTAKPEFLAAFSEEELNAYLEHLMELDLEELVVCS